jgi:hypothetical protein
MVLRALLVWSLLLLLAVLNGALREAVLGPQLGQRAGHVISTLLLSAIVLAVTWVTLPWIGVRTGPAAWGIGALWLVLTLAFEFVAGHYVFGTSWRALVEDYDVRGGRVWPLVLLATLAAPALVLWLRSR